MIIAQSLTKKYGNITALKDVSFEISPGDICGILGPNGAGKTTLFKILCGLITPDTGSFEIKSTKRKSIGAIIEKPAIYEYLSARDNLKILSKMQGTDTSENSIIGLLKTVGLPLNRNDASRNYSLGMKQRLGLAIALINEPDVLILDEPFLGLDPVAMKSLSVLLSILAQEKQIAILLSSHLLGELTNTCNTLKIMQQGKIIKTGRTSDILNSTTKKYMICGKNLEQSILLKKYEPIFNNECAVLNLEAKEAPDFLSSMVLEGNKITYFGPDINIRELYGKG